MSVTCQTPHGKRVHLQNGTSLTPWPACNLYGAYMESERSVVTCDQCVRVEAAIIMRNAAQKLAECGLFLSEILS